MQEQHDVIRYATTRDGWKLPIIDVTHPAFAIADSTHAIEVLRAEFLETENKQRMPRFALRLMMHLLARKSLLLRSLMTPENTFLSGLSTYMMKLGAKNLVPPVNSRTDQHIAASPGTTSMRIRLQQTAGLLAEGLEAELNNMPDAPLHLANIAGGPGIDSINALILLRKQWPDRMHRPISIHVFDPDEAGPNFGAAALASLKEEGGTLEDLDITLHHRKYDWSNTEPLEAWIRETASQICLIAASSEGGLFEYGDDATVIANLKALAVAGDALKLVVGSVTRADEITLRMMASSPYKLVHRGVQGLAPLADAAGFAVAEVRSALTSDQVLLRLHR